MVLDEDEIDARVSHLLDQLEKPGLTFAQTTLLWAQIEQLQQLQQA